MVVKNPFGQDPMDFNEDTAASRVGRRIREIRKVREMNQSELGSIVELSGDRVQKYENGARKPKQELLKKFASALGVSTLALTDPVVSNYLGCMYALFEMENLYGLNIKRVDNRIVISFGDGISGQLNEYLDAWEKKYRQKEDDLNKTTTEDERLPILNDYRMWEWTFPNALAETTSKALKKAQIQSKIDELKKELAELKDEPDE